MSLDEIDLAAEATSMHQSTQWGMQAFQVLIPLVKACIEFESIGQWKLMIKAMILLFNLGERRVGKNHILNICLPSLNVNVKEFYD